MSGLPSPVPALHSLEAEVMDAVWDVEEATVRDVMDALNRKASKPRAYTTYMTILGRLQTKGLLTRRREGKTDYYAPVCTAAEYRDRRAQAEIAALVDTFGDVALSHFARQVADLDPERRKALERLARDG
jgi:predicted transcriptional regulator